MTTVTVGTVIRDAKLILQEVTAAGTRWTNEELIGWLNEAYLQIVQIRPDAASVNEPLGLNVGTKQTLPSAGLRLLDVVRNTAGGSNKTAVMRINRDTLDRTRRTWHNDTASIDIEQFMFDDLDPRTFYVYPPAATGAEVEIIYSTAPAGHSVAGGLAAIESDLIKLEDTYKPVIVDYILYRAYAKDAEHSANMGRVQLHQAAYQSALGLKVQVDRASSPNAPDNSSNPPRAR